MNYGTRITQIQNLHWKFPHQTSHVKLEKLRDYQLEKIRILVKTYHEKSWFNISSEQWYNDITYLLKFRKINREVKDVIDFENIIRIY